MSDFEQQFDEIRDQIARIEEKVDILLAGQTPPEASEPMTDEEFGNKYGAFSPPGYPDGKWWPAHSNTESLSVQFEYHVNCYMGTERSLPRDEGGNKIPTPLEDIRPYYDEDAPEWREGEDPELYRQEVEFASRYRGTPQPLKDPGD